MKYFLLLFLICFISSCNFPEDDSDLMKKDKKAWLIKYWTPAFKNAIFFKDDKTQLCFSVIGHTIAYVPCSLEVEKIAIHINSGDL